MDNRGTSNITHHEACPRCRSWGADRKGDNLGVFDDGHRWCFSCGYFEPSTQAGITYVQTKLSNMETNKESKPVLRLPDDYTTSLPDVARNWLARYGILPSEMQSAKIGWSEGLKRVILPVFASTGPLVFYQARALDTRPQKVLTWGSAEDTFYILGGRHDSSKIVLTEDLLSAIKVARHECSMPLWGSNISDARLLRLAKIADTLLIWLDRDKANYAIARKIRAANLFKQACTIITKEDPKMYNDFELKDWLRAAK